MLPEIVLSLYKMKLIPNTSPAAARTFFGFGDALLSNRITISSSNLPGIRMTIRYNGFKWYKLYKWYRWFPTSSPQFAIGGFPHLPRNSLGSQLVPAFFLSGSTLRPSLGGSSSNTCAVSLPGRGSVRNRSARKRGSKLDFVEILHTIMQFIQ